MIIIDGATFELQRKGGTAVLIVQRKPFALSMRITVDELSQLAEQLQQDAKVWRQAQRPDYYQILNLSRSASADDVKKAYRHKSRQHHPDVSAENAGGATQQLINEAFETLSNPQARQCYDAQCA